MVWEKDFTVEDTEGVTKGEGNFNGYVDFADGILKYTKDGVSYLDAQGKVVWNQSYEMKSPIDHVLELDALDEPDKDRSTSFSQPHPPRMRPWKPW